MPAVPPNSLIVITGITGFIGSHIGLTALKAGFRVRGIVRSLERAEELKKAYTKEGADLSKLDIAVVDDFLGQIGKVFEGAAGVLHVALPGSLEEGSDPKENTEWNLAILRAAAKVPTIKRVVITSSSVAVLTPGGFRDEPLTDKIWNDEAVEKYNAMKEDDPQKEWLRYPVAKTVSEKAAFKWVEDEKPSFDLVTVLPNVNFGPVLFGGPRSTVGWIDALLKNDTQWAKMIPAQWFVDVRDDARLHVAALTNESLSGKRVLAYAEPNGWNKVLAILRKEFPKVELPADIEGKQGEVEPQKVDNSLATELLGGKWISLEKSVVDTAKSFGF